MSSKINVSDIFKGHFKTLKNADTNNSSGQDIFTFIIAPTIMSIAFVWLNHPFSNELISLLVNFGSIFTALLLSVLVLVYEQENKLDERNKSNPLPSYDAKKTLLLELYYNICYSMIISLFLVLMCLIETIIQNKCFLLFSVKIDICLYAISPVIMFLAIHLILTIVMIIKRMHVLLTL